MASADPHRRAVLWDLDGTLADSREYHWRSWLEAMALEGVRITEEDFAASFGQRNDAILTAWLGADVGPARMQRVAATKEEAYRRMVREEGIEPLPGAAEWVRALHETGWRQAIASSAPRANVDVMQGALHFQGFIDTLVSAEDVLRGKPDPEVFLAAAARLGVPPERCIVVEDAAAGIEAGRAGGMKTVGVGPGETEAADVVVPSLAELPEGVFERLLGEGIRGSD